MFTNSLQGRRKEFGQSRGIIDDQSARAQSAQGPNSTSHDQITHKSNSTIPPPSHHSNTTSYGTAATVGHPGNVTRTRSNNGSFFGRITSSISGFLRRRRTDRRGGT